MKKVVKPRPSFALRMLFFGGRTLFKYIYKLNHRVYMRLYPKYLKRIGINIIGNPVYIAPSASFDASDYSMITLHDKCVISSEVRLLTHDYALSRVAIAKGMDLKKEARLIKPIVIGENSFIGFRSIIMPGVRIGKNVIVGAGSIVTKNVDDNFIIGGNPAKKISTINEYWEKIQNSDYLYFE